MGALALHKQEVRGETDGLHDEHDGRSLPARRQGHTPGGRKRTTTVTSVLGRTLRRILQIGAILAVLVGLAYLVSRLARGRTPAPAPTPRPELVADVPRAPEPAPELQERELAAWVEPDEGACPASHPIVLGVASSVLAVIFSLPGAVDAPWTT